MALTVSLAACSGEKGKNTDTSAVTPIAEAFLKNIEVVANND